MNWKKRITNKAFWLALVPAILLLVQQVAIMFGYQLDFTELETQVLGIINTVFVLLAIMGVVVDPTTPGVADNKAEATDERIEGAPDDYEADAAPEGEVVDATD